MDFECPSCNRQGDIDDNMLPPQGLLVTCHRCGHKFTIQKVAQAAEEPQPDFVFSPAEPSSSPPNDMPADKDACPTAVSVIGWIFIGMSALMIFSALMSLAAFSMMPPMDEAMRDMPAAFPRELRGMFGLFKYFHVLSIGQIVVAAFTLFAGIRFLQRRAWARVYLEVLSWVSIALLVLYVGWWGYMWSQITSSFPKQMGNCGPPIGFFRGMGIVMALFNLIIFATPLVVIIHYLRKESVRGACER